METNLKKSSKRKRVTSTELYAINKKPKFVGQSRLQEDGTYLMVWNIDGVEYETLNKI